MVCALPAKQWGSRNGQCPRCPVPFFQLALQLLVLHPSPLLCRLLLGGIITHYTYNKKLRAFLLIYLMHDQVQNLCVLQSLL